MFAKEIKAVANQMLEEINAKGVIEKVYFSEYLIQ